MKKKIVKTKKSKITKISKVTRISRAKKKTDFEKVVKKLVKIFDGFKNTCIIKFELFKEWFKGTKYGSIVLKDIKTYVGVLVLIIISFTLFMCTNKIYKHNIEVLNYENELMAHPKNSYDGNSFVTDTYPIFKDVMLVGDSYAHFVSYDIGFDVLNYSCPGFTLEMLKSVFDVALKTKKKYVTIFIGPNDFYANTSLSDFSNRLSHYVKELRDKMGAKVILCTYLHSVFSKTIEGNKTCAHSIDEYNNEIKKLVSEKDGIYFLDLSDLDEHEKYRKETPTGPDDIHYNYEFSIKYINKLYDKLMYIREKEIYNG